MGATTISRPRSGTGTIPIIRATPIGVIEMIETIVTATAMIITGGTTIEVPHMSPRTSPRKLLVRSPFVGMAKCHPDNEMNTAKADGELLECIGATIVLLLLCVSFGAAFV
jgi:hypothetical protein